MTNFIFKSASDFKKISQHIESQLDVLLTEQRKQRADLQYVLSLLKYLKNDKKLQTTVEDYYSTPPVFEENVIHPEDIPDED